MRHIGDEAFEISECLPFFTPLPGGWMGENNPMEGDFVEADLPCNSPIRPTLSKRRVCNPADPAESLISEEGLDEIVECHGDTRYPAGL